MIIREDRQPVSETRSMLLDFSSAIENDNLEDITRTDFVIAMDFLASIKSRVDGVAGIRQDHAYAKIPILHEDWASLEESVVAIKERYYELYKINHTPETNLVSLRSVSSIVRYALYNEKGFNLNGKHRNGSLFDDAGFDANGFDVNGYNRDGYDRNGFDKDGFDREGYNRKGYGKDGYDRSGYGIDGYNKQGYDRYGCGRDGYTKDGFDRKGYDKHGYNRAGFDVAGFNREGYDKYGYNRRGFNRKGFHKNGTRLDENGFNVHGYYIDGSRYDESGFDCEGNPEGLFHDNEWKENIDRIDNEGLSEEEKSIVKHYFNGYKS